MMTTPGQIVVATDFSPASSAAVRLAGTMAQIFKVKVTLLHVFEYAAEHRYPIPVGWMVETIRRDIRIQIGIVQRQAAKDHPSGLHQLQDPIEVGSLVAV